MCGRGRRDCWIEDGPEELTRDGFIPIIRYVGSLRSCGAFSIGGKNMEDIIAKVQQSFQKAFDVDPQSVSIDTTPDDVVGWDSVGHLELAACLESVFGVSFDVDELMEMENVREIVRILQLKLNGA